MIIRNGKLVLESQKEILETIGIMCGSMNENEGP